MLKEGYLAKMKNYPEDEEKILVMRDRGNNELAPSKELLRDWKQDKITWEEYVERFVREMNHPESIKRMKEINKMSKERDVRLICFEKNPPCHRFILMELIKECD